MKTIKRKGLQYKVVSEREIIDGIYTMVCHADISVLKIDIDYLPGRKVTYKETEITLLSLDIEAILCARKGGFIALDT